MTRAKFNKRLLEVLTEEASLPAKWFYCSFADEAPIGFCGAVIIQARGVAEIGVLTHKMHISPGGQMLAAEIPEHMLPPESYRNRLLSASEVKVLWPDAKTLGELEAEDP